MSEKQQEAAERLFIHVGSQVETKPCGCGGDVEYVRADLTRQPTSERCGEFNLPLRIEGWHSSLTESGWYIRNSLDQIVATVHFEKGEEPTRKSINAGNALARALVDAMNRVATTGAGEGTERDEWLPYVHETCPRDTPVWLVFPSGNVSLHTLTRRPFFWYEDDPTHYMIATMPAAPATVAEEKRCEE